MNTKDKGNLSEMMALAAFTAQGHQVSVPIGENARYDLIADLHGILSRVQVKTGRLKKDGSVLRFNTRSAYRCANGTIVHADYTGSVDHFAVYCHELATVYLISIKDMVTVSVGSLRIKATKNNQKSGTLEASDYVLYQFGV